MRCKVIPPKWLLDRYPKRFLSRRAWSTQYWLDGTGHEVKTYYVTAGTVKYLRCILRCCTSLLIGPFKALALGGIRVPRPPSSGERFVPFMNSLCNYALAAEEISGCYYICNYAFMNSLCNYALAAEEISGIYYICNYAISALIIYVITIGFYSLSSYFLLRNYVDNIF